MQTQHSITVAADIRRSVPGKLLSQARNLSIVLVGEQTEEDAKAKGGIRIVTKGQVVVTGEASGVHMLDKIISHIREKAGGRQVSDRMTVKKSS